MGHSYACDGIAVTSLRWRWWPVNRTERVGATGIGRATVVIDAASEHCDHKCHGHRESDPTHYFGNFPQFDAKFLSALRPAEETGPRMLRAFASVPRRLGYSPVVTSGHPRTTMSGKWASVSWGLARQFEKVCLTATNNRCAAMDID